MVVVDQSVTNAHWRDGDRRGLSRDGELPILRRHAKARSQAALQQRHARCHAIHDDVVGADAKRGAVAMRPATALHSGRRPAGTLADRGRLLRWMMSAIFPLCRADAD